MLGVSGGITTLLPLRETWWSQAESNRRPLECHSKDNRFPELARLSSAFQRWLAAGISAIILSPGRSPRFLFGVTPVFPEHGGVDERANHEDRR
jgi:hypothetical protein